MRNLTQYPLRFQVEDRDFTVPADPAGPAFRPVRRAVTAGVVAIGGVEIPVEDQELGEVDLPDDDAPLIVPILTAQHLLATGRSGPNVFVPHGTARDGKGQIVGHTGLARVVEAPTAKAASALEPLDTLRELRVLTPHAADFYLNGTDSAPVLSIASSMSDPSIGRQDEQVHATGEVVETEQGALPVSEIRYGKVNLPDPEPGIGLIVSRVTAGAAAGRSDLLVPITVGKNGRPIGASGLNRIY